MHKLNQGSCSCSSSLPFSNARCRVSNAFTQMCSSSAHFLSHLKFFSFHLEVPPTTLCTSLLTVVFPAWHSKHLNTSLFLVFRFGVLNASNYISYSFIPVFFYKSMLKRDVLINMCCINFLAFIIIFL